MRASVVGLLALLAVACSRTTIQEPHTVNGQTFFVERTEPSIGEQLFNAVANDCAGGARDDDAAIAKVSTPEGCDRSRFVVEYVVDGVYRIETCDQTWRVRCRHDTTASGPGKGPGSLGCTVSCSVEDRYRTAGF